MALLKTVKLQLDSIPTNVINTSTYSSTYHYSKTIFYTISVKIVESLISNVKVAILYKSAISVSNNVCYEFQPKLRN